LIAKIRARSASAAGAIVNGPRGGIQMSCGSSLAVQVLPLVLRLAGGERTRPARHGIKGGVRSALPE
jgi:hypothetical protein